MFQILLEGIQLVLGGGGLVEIPFSSPFREKLISLSEAAVLLDAKILKSKQIKDRQKIKHHQNTFM